MGDIRVDRVGWIAKRLYVSPVMILYPVQQRTTVGVPVDVSLVRWRLNKDKIARAGKLLPSNTSIQETAKTGRGTSVFISVVVEKNGLGLEKLKLLFDDAPRFLFVGVHPVGYPMPPCQDAAISLLPIAHAPRKGPRFEAAGDIRRDIHAAYNRAVGGS